MRPTLALLACCCFLATPMRGAEPLLPSGDTPASLAGGLLFFRQGNQTTLSLGGVVFPRRVKVTTATPEGPVVTYFRLPAILNSPATPPLPQSAPAMLWVEMSDTYGIIYVAGELLRSQGTLRPLQSPPLPPGTAYPLHLRAAFKVGDNLLIEDRQVLLRAGESTTVKFDGSRALSVPLPRNDAELAAFRRSMNQ